MKNLGLSILRLEDGAEKVAEYISGDE